MNLKFTIWCIGKRSQCSIKAVIYQLQRKKGGMEEGRKEWRWEGEVEGGREVYVEHMLKITIHCIIPVMRLVSLYDQHLPVKFSA